MKKLFSLKNIEFLILSSFLINPVNVNAEYPKTDLDFALLPPYCKARSSGDTSSLYKQWERKLGPDFLHIHHYCAGLHTLNLAFKENDKTQKNYLINVAISEMDYIPDHASEKFIILPKLYYDQGKAYEMMTKDDKAIESYEKSIKSNPKIAMPYAALSDLYKRKNMLEKAKEILNMGLTNKNDSKLLLEKIKDFK